MALTCGEVFAGISGFGLGAERAGIRTVWRIEIDRACQSVLRRHYPDTPLYDDVLECGVHNLEKVDILCGGWPCQDLSVAGKRAGIYGERSSLFFELVRLTRELRPSFLVWENVPGLLSAGNGRDFAKVLMALDSIGYCGAWTMLDAQWFGVAQRRRRIFGVFAQSNIGAGCCAEILSFVARGAWDTPPRREAGEGVAITTVGSLDSGGADRPGSHGYAGMMSGAQQSVNAGHIIANPLGAKASGWRGDLDNDTYVAGSVSSKWAKGIGGPTGDEAYNLVGIQMNFIRRPRIGDYAGSLSAQPGDAQFNGVWDRQMGVRRLTPTECEKLQGFPDIENSVTIQVCSDRLRNYASAVIISRKSPRHAGHVVGSEASGLAWFAESYLSSSRPQIEKPVHNHVVINCGENTVEIRSHERLFLSANFAESKNLFPRFTRNADFALLLAGINSIAVQITPPGAVASHQNEPSLTHHLNGEMPVRRSGDEMIPPAGVVNRDLITAKELLKYITFGHSPNVNTERKLAILSCYVLDAISGYIPNEILSASTFMIEINTRFGWTYPQSDSVRYRQLGNAVCVPVAEWLFRRIEAAGC